MKKDKYVYAVVCKSTGQVVIAFAKKEDIDDEYLTHEYSVQCVWVFN